MSLSEMFYVIAMHGSNYPHQIAGPALEEEDINCISSADLACGPLAEQSVPSLGCFLGLELPEHKAW